MRNNLANIESNPHIMESLGEFVRYKPLWLLAIAGAGTLWILQANGQLVPPKNIQQYVPNSADAIALLTNAAIAAGLPESWGSDPDTHWVMDKESKGWVGVPNYTYGIRRFNRNRWSEVWDEIKSGVSSTSSTATGLGQLLVANVNKFYPDGVNGIGDPMNEAIGFLRYINDRYGSPATTRSVYGTIADYVNDRTGKTMHKGFKEGY